MHGRVIIGPVFFLVNLVLLCYYYSIGPWAKHELLKNAITKKGKFQKRRIGLC